MKYISRTVWVLSLVSLFTDTASEMLYPVMPIYLKTIGFSIVLIGMLEGLAEATAGLSKGYFGKLSDHSGQRAPFVQVGYAFSAISKPLIAVFANPLWIFLQERLTVSEKASGPGPAMPFSQMKPHPKQKVRYLVSTAQWIHSVQLSDLPWH